MNKTTVSSFRSDLKHYSLTHLVAGFITVLVGFTSSVALVFQAASLSGADVAGVSSWIFSLSLGMGILCIYFSIRYKVPVLVAWSTPGAAILISGIHGYSISEMMGVFVFSSVLILIAGLTGWFEKLMNKVPMAIASAMLAGVLVRFGADVFVSMKTEFWLSFGMFVVYLLTKRFYPRWTMVVVLISGIALAMSFGLLHFETFQFALADPTWTTPTFTWSSIVSLGIPLFVVTMASQNIPGVAILRAFDYHPPTSKLITGMGALNLLLAPFGAFALNLAAITAAICMGKEVDENPKRRYLAAVTAGVFYLVIALLGGTVAALFAAFPKELVMTVAGLALFATIASGLANAMKEESSREAALMTFLIAASGLSFLGIGSAFWALLIGVGVYMLSKTKKSPSN